jgi:hypothetical protein
MVWRRSSIRLFSPASYVPAGIKYTELEAFEDDTHRPVLDASLKELRVIRSHARPERPGYFQLPLDEKVKVVAPKGGKVAGKKRRAVASGGSKRQKGTAQYMDIAAEIEAELAEKKKDDAKLPEHDWPYPLWLPPKNAPRDPSRDIYKASLHPGRLPHGHGGTNRFGFREWILCRPADVQYSEPTMISPDCPRGTILVRSATTNLVWRMFATLIRAEGCDEDGKLRLGNDKTKQCRHSDARPSDGVTLALDPHTVQGGWLTYSNGNVPSIEELFRSGRYEVGDLFAMSTVQYNSRVAIDMESRVSETKNGKRRSTRAPARYPPQAKWEDNTVVQSLCLAFRGAGRNTKVPWLYRASVRRAHRPTHVLFVVYREKAAPTPALPGFDVKRFDVPVICNCPGPQVYYSVSHKTPLTPSKSNVAKDPHITVPYSREAAKQRLREAIERGESIRPPSSAADEESEAGSEPASVESEAESEESDEEDDTE